MKDRTVNLSDVSPTHYITSYLNFELDDSATRVMVIAPNGLIAYIAVYESGVNRNQLEDIKDWMIDMHAEDIQENMEKLGYVCLADYPADAYLCE